MVGKRTMFEIDILPLSFADQHKLIELLQDDFTKLTTSASLSNSDLVKIVSQLITKHIPVFLNFVVQISPPDPDMNLLSCLTNKQIVEIARIIYEVNFSPLSEEFGKITKNLPNLTKPSGMSVENTPNTTSNTFTNTPSVKEV